MNKKVVKKTVHWLLFVFIVIYLITGLGITQYRTIEPLTFGLLSKSLSLNIHQNLLIPFLALLGLHIFFRPILWVRSRLTRHYKTRM